MAIALITEVWRHAPEALTPSEFIVLLRVADACGEENRMMWESVQTLARHARVSERHVFRCLDRLKELNVIEDPHEREWPPAAKGYKSVVRRVLEPALWGTSETPDNPSGVTPRSDNPKATTSYNSRETTSLYGARPEGARQKKRGKAQPEEREFVFGQDSGQEDPQEPRSRPNQADPDLEVTPTSPSPQKGSRDSRPKPDTAMGLALHFRDRALAFAWAEGDVNVKALAANIAGWRRSGVAAADIRAMIDHYADVPGFRTPSKVPWVDFVAKRAALVAALKMGDGTAEMESIRFDPDAWA